MVATNEMGMTRGGNNRFTWSNERPLIGRVDYRDDSSYLLEFVGHSNHLYLIESSSNLTAWTQLGAATALATRTNFQFISQPNGTAPHRFYRTRLP